MRATTRESAACASAPAPPRTSTCGGSAAADASPWPISSASTQLSAAIASRRDTATDRAATEANTAIVTTATTGEAPVSTPSAPDAPMSGAMASCQLKRVRAGASKATKPVMDAPIVTAAAAGDLSSMSTTTAIPTGIATKNPRRNAGAAVPRSRQLSGIKPMRAS